MRGNVVRTRCRKFKRSLRISNVYWCVIIFFLEFPESFAKGMCGNYNFKFFMLRIARIGARASQMKKTSFLHFNGPSQFINICHVYCFFLKI
jgi:hypothetical protein